MGFIKSVIRIIAIGCYLVTVNCLIQSNDSNDIVDILSDEFIIRINSVNSTWKARRNFHISTSLGYIKGLLGVLEEHGLAHKLQVQFNRTKLPDNFDSRLQWPYCPTIGEIRDQGSCGSCWAFGAVETMSDRYCIHSKGDVNVYLSAENLISCCFSCGKGCHGGSSPDAWKYWVEHGIVSGGPYNSSQGCQPYEIPSCEHHMHGTRPDCSMLPLPTPTCKNSCREDYPISYTDDLRYGLSAYSMEGEPEIMQEIYQNGPVEATMKVYADFLHYSSGIYEYIDGPCLGKHAVKIIGWGVDIDSNTPYWIVANSFNYDWGDNGYFKIKRGNDECSIESHVTAGLPKLSP